MPQPEYQSIGGFNSWNTFSGTPGDTLITSGPGRLNQILQQTQMQSGQAMIFYDAPVATSGGPFAASGHVIVGVCPPTYGGGFVSGQVQAVVVTPLRFDFPFRSGLCVAQKSGQPGVSIAYTKENNAF